MIQYPLGVRAYNDDDEVLMMLESEGLLGKAKKMLSTTPHGGLLVYDKGIPEPTERWIIQEFRGNPTDNGWTLMIYPMAALDHPLIQQSLAAIEKARGITVQSVIEKGIFVDIHVPDTKRN